MSKIRQRIIRAGLAIGMIGMLVLYPNDNVYAAEASVTFGSEGYESEVGATFSVGLYISGDDTLGDYRVTVAYDSSRMEYLDGADAVDEESGLLHFSGTSTKEEIKRWLRFRTISGGEGYFRVDEAKIDGTEDAFDIVEQAEASVTLEGEDTAAETDEVTEEDEEDASTTTEEQIASTVKERDKKLPAIFYNVYFAAFMAFALIFVLIEIAVYGVSGWIKKKKGEEDKSTEDSSKLVIMDMNGAAQKRDRAEQPVIRVEDVVMEFHLASQETSGIKDYIIQFLKREISYRRLYALYHVSFDVYKGEVVGIIGTNGSGKSTLLKLVSGALRPTSGHIAVDRRKVQLLTLGTGFDNELTGRENVYLNGAIIGHSKKFLDEHYDEIVEFAELSDFMDEKVKNYSSGMVSRLAFAIATVGDAAEILILDEVLSVGDEFFRKKSLARVKEMIHGGSTVLLVSHGMGTILDNCTRCVWIEKGILKMQGDPKVVCKAYQTQNKKSA